MPGLPQNILDRGLAFVADSFGTTFWVGFFLVLATFIPIAFLPRKKQVAKTDESGSSVDFPLYERILGIQKVVLRQVFDASVMSRILNNSLKAEKGEKFNK